MRLQLGSEREGKRTEQKYEVSSSSDSGMPQERNMNAWSQIFHSQSFSAISVVQTLCFDWCHLLTNLAEKYQRLNRYVTVGYVGRAAEF